MKARSCLFSRVIVGLLLVSLVALTSLAWAANAPTDSSDLAAYKGTKLKLVQWAAHGPGGGAVRMSEGDVVWPEITRVTGVSIDWDASFDNGGQDTQVKMQQIVASKQYPHLIVNNPGGEQFKQLVDNKQIWDLTKLVPKYCPNIMRLIPKDKLAAIWNNDKINAYQPGKIFALPVGMQPQWAKLVDPSIDQAKFMSFAQPSDPLGVIWLREDILKTIYPNAKTTKDIEKIYMQKGKFTKSEVLDVPIDSKEDFRNLLVKIKALNLKEGNQAVAPFFVNDGNKDNWALLTVLGCLFGWHPNMNQNPSSANYMTYWDKETKKVQYMYDQPFFKAALKFYNDLVRDGLVPEDCLVDSNAQFTEKLNNALYAMTYAWLLPNYAVMKQAGKDYLYRKVYLNIKQNSSKFAWFVGNPANGLGTYAFFKSKVKEKDLPQLLKWLDFMVSDLGQQLAGWGPRSAGLWTVRDGKRFFKNKDLMESMVYGAKNDQYFFYNLLPANRDFPLPWNTYPSYVANGMTKYAPAYVYDKARQSADAMNYFSMNLIEPLTLIQGLDPDLWIFKTPGTDQFWKVRTEWETKILKIFTAKSDAEFEQFYKELVDFSVANGLDTASLVEINRQYKEDKNKEFMKYLQ